MSLSNLKEAFAEDYAILEKLWLSFLEKSETALGQKVSHRLQSYTGKRLRPMMVLAVAALHSEKNLFVDSLALATELLHTATLLHDDVVDHATERRFGLTLNESDGNKTAILTGDYLFAESLLTVQKCGDKGLFRVLAETTASLSEGELLQMRSAGDLTIPQETYFHIVDCKTASLFGFSAYAGALSGDESYRARLRAFGVLFGRIYQMMDDILDYYPVQTGKTARTDFLEKKITLPILLLRDEDFGRLKTVFLDSPHWEGLMMMMEEYKIYDRLLEHVQQKVEEVQSFLKPFRGTREGEALCALCDFCLSPL